MANFNVHLGTATAAGVALAGYGLAMDLWSIQQTPIMTGLAAFGGILPDIDADKSHSVRLIFTVLAIIAAFSTLAFTRPRLSLVAATCLALGAYVVIRDVLGLIFRALTQHRASWHSLLATAMVACTTVAISFHCFAQSACLAWWQGLAIAGGMLIHLLLDECFSIDLEGARLKRSFGTAFKLCDHRRPFATFLMLGATLLAAPWVPAWPFQLFS